LSPIDDPAHIDPERLAALLDGRLSSAEADVVRMQLADADDDTLAAYADALVIVAAHAVPDGAPLPPQPTVVPITRARSRRLWLTTALLAAGLTGLAVFLSRPSRLPPERYLAPSPGVLAMAIGANASVPSEPGWSVTRGSADQISERARAVRVGALLTDFELIAERGGTPTAQGLSLAELLSGAQFGAPIAIRFRDITRGTMDAQLRHSLELQAAGVVDSSLAHAGSWLEAARLAIDAGNIGFLDTYPPEKALSSVRQSALLNASERAAIERLVTLSERRPRNNDAMRAALRDLLGVLAR
jgi:hypothetical protein